MTTRYSWWLKTNRAYTVNDKKVNFSIYRGPPDTVGPLYFTYSRATFDELEFYLFSGFGVKM